MIFSVFFEKLLGMREAFIRPDGQNIIAGYNPSRSELKDSN